VCAHRTAIQCSIFCKNGYERTHYKDTAHYSLYKRFLEHPEDMLTGLGIG